MSTPSPSVDVLVRGGGPVGLAAALALSRQGLAVALHAPLPATPAGPDIRAYALNSASVTLLQQLRVWDAVPPDARTAVHDMHVRGDVPGAAIDFSAWQQGLAELAWIVDAAELDLALQTAAGFSPHIQRVDHPVPAALQVLADGKDSASREALGVTVQRHAYGHRGVATRVQATEPHQGLARQWFRSPEVLALLPLDRPAPGRSYGVVWSVPDARALELLALDDPSFGAALTAATEGAVGSLQTAGPRAAWPLSRSEASAVHGPGWVLVGDAAHTVHPLAGQGLNLGLADVATLASVIAERTSREPWRALGDERLLARYARERRVPTWAMATVCDGLWQLFAHPDPLVRTLRNQGLSAVNKLAPLKRLLTGRALGG